MKSISIGQRMRKAKSLAVRHEIALDWAANWRHDYEVTLLKLQEALRLEETGNAEQYAAQIAAIQEKGMRGLSTVIESLVEAGESH